MLEKLFDKYFTKKIEYELINFLSIYNIDEKFVYGKNLFSLYVKNRKWKDEEYILIYTMPYVESFNTLMDIEKIKKELQDYMKDGKLINGRWRNNYSNF